MLRVQRDLSYGTRSQPQGVEFAVSFTCLTHSRRCAPFLLALSLTARRGGIVLSSGQDAVDASLLVHGWVVSKSPLLLMCNQLVFVFSRLRSGPNKAATLSEQQHSPAELVQFLLRRRVRLAQGDHEHAPLWEEADVPKVCVVLMLCSLRAHLLSRLYLLRYVFFLVLRVYCLLVDPL